jgi:hypothetical protein
MSKYTWAWSNEDATYINKANSLFEILDTVLDSYFWDDEQYTITELNGKFFIFLKVYYGSLECEVDASLSEVSDYLHLVARHEDRPDTFAISVD